MKTIPKTIDKLTNTEIVDYLRENRQVIVPLFIEKWVMELYLEGQFTPEQFKEFQQQIKQNFTPYFFDEIREWALFNDNVLIDPRPEPNPEDLPF